MTEEQILAKSYEILSKYREGEANAIDTCKIVSEMYKNNISEEIINAFINNLE